MSKIQDLTGQKFGRLTVLKFDEIKNKHYFWICKCDCGKICSVESSQLKSGKTKSCGCYKIDIIKKHYKTNTRLYTIWRGIKKRCLNKNLKGFYRYGGRGISVCKEWEKDFISFYNWAIQNGYKDNLTIDRINNDGNYEPNNCRWVTMEEQSQNTCKVINLTYNFHTYSISKWARLLGISRHTLYARYKRGLNVEEILGISKAKDGNNE